MGWMWGMRKSGFLDESQVSRLDNSSCPWGKEQECPCFSFVHHTTVCTDTQMEFEVCLNSPQVELAFKLKVEINQWVCLLGVGLRME